MLRATSQVWCPSMRVRERSATLTQAEVDAVLVPREVTVREARDGENAFVAADSPGRYRRTLHVEPRDDGGFDVRQRVELAAAAAPGSRARLLGPLLARHPGRILPAAPAPFWFPPPRLATPAPSASTRLPTASAGWLTR